MIIQNVKDLNFYRLNSEYKKTQDQITEIQKGIYDLDVMKLKLERQKLDLDAQLRNIESQIMTDLDKRK